MQTKRDGIGSAILGGICESDGKDFLLEKGDAALDIILDFELLKTIPGLQTIAAFISASCTVHDRLFLQKVWLFMRPVEKLSAKDKREFLDKLNDKPDFRKKLGNALVLILDKLDDLEKPEMLAKCFAALVRGKIEEATFRRLAAAVDIGFMDDLLQFAKESNEQEEARPYYPQLIRTNLVELGDIAAVGKTGKLGADGSPARGARLKYQRTHLGRVFQEIQSGKI